MRVRRVNRYYCDFCKKANCSAASITKHESRCTLNPNRVCGMCKLMEEVQPSMQSLLDALPDRTALLRPVEEFDSFNDLDEAAVRRLRDAAGNCPACMMAALRQKKIPVVCAIGFDFTKECKSIWADFNAAQYENVGRYV